MPTENKRKRSARVLGVAPGGDIEAALDKEKELEEEERRAEILRERTKKRQKKNSASADDEILVETDFLKRMTEEQWKTLSRKEKEELSEKYTEIKKPTAKRTGGEVTGIVFVPKNNGSFLSKLLAQPDQTIKDDIIGKCKFSDFDGVDAVGFSVHRPNAKNGWDDELNKVPLKKNHVYKLLAGKHETPYVYQTDNEGRVQFVTGKLEYTKNASEERGTNQKNAVAAKGGLKGKQGSYQNHDDAGHIIGARFRGPDALINYFPQHTVPNEIGQWKNIEGLMAAELKLGNEVTFNVVMEYPEHKPGETASQRPSASIVTAIIRDGEPPHAEKSLVSRIENPKPVDPATLSDNDLIKNNPSKNKAKTSK